MLTREILRESARSLPEIKQLPALSMAESIETLRGFELVFKEVICVKVVFCLKKCIIPRLIFRRMEFDWRSDIQFYCKTYSRNVIMEALKYSNFKIKCQ